MAVARGATNRAEAKVRFRGHLETLLDAELYFIFIQLLCFDRHVRTPQLDMRTLRHLRHNQFQLHLYPFVGTSDQRYGDFD